MKKKIIAIIISVVFLTPAPSHGGIDDFRNLSDTDLATTKQKATDRINFIDEYNAALSGIAPIADKETLWVHQRHLLGLIRDWNKMTPQDMNSPDACHRFATNTRNLSRAFSRDFSEYRTLPDLSEEALVLRARLEALAFLLDTELEMMEVGAEGGMSAITNVGVSCPAIQAPEVKAKGLQIKNELSDLLLETWGRPGVNDAFPVSAHLLRAVNKDQKLKAKWGPAQVVTEAAIGIILILFVTRSLWPALKVIAGHKYLTTLIIGGALTLGTYGGYKGYEFYNRNFPLDTRSADPWTQLQLSAESILSISTENLRAYYTLVNALEHSQLEYNKHIIAQLEPQMKMARDRFGSLEAAKTLAKTKLEEINTVLGERETASPK